MGVNCIIYVPPQYVGTLIFPTVYINTLGYTHAYILSLCIDIKHKAIMGLTTFDLVVILSRYEIHTILSPEEYWL